MKNIELARLFDQIGDILEFRGELIFKINAYRKASRAIQELTVDVADLWQQNKLVEIPGIGKGLQEKITEYLSTGTIAEMDTLLQGVPQDLFELLSIQNFGPKTAALAYKQLGVETIADLQRVIADGSLAQLPGMGAKKVENIRKGLELRASASERLSIGLAIPVVEEILDYLQKTAGDKIGRITSAGSVRRGRETVHDIDILVETSEGTDVIDAFVQMPGVTRILGSGNTKGSIILQDRVQVDVRAVDKNSFGAAQQYFTGSKEHNVRLREIAKKMGLKINEYGVFSGEERRGGENEEEVYQLLGLKWIPAELREDRGEIEAAANDQLPELVDLKDIKSDLHIHSNSSDGQYSLADMAEEVRNRGYTHMAFCDHSRSARYANGLEETRLLRQIEEIRKLQKKYSDFTILAGSEVDILPDGSLDFPDSLLAQLDFVVASIHAAFKTDPTGRTLAAMQNKYVDVIGHPTGRLISRREGFEIDMTAVIEMARITGTALEINSFWDRLDLRDLHARLAVEQGVKLSINTDAHHPTHLPMMRYGVATARRGWVRKSDVINTFSLNDLKKWQKRNQTVSKRVK